MGKRILKKEGQGLTRRIRKNTACAQCAAADDGYAVIKYAVAEDNFAGIICNIYEGTN